MGRTQQGDVVRLTTSDPAEAAAFAARLVGSEGIVRVEKPYAWPSEVETVLRDAGWHPGRAVDTRVWKERLEQDGFRSHAAAEGFLREFGELTVGHRGGGITRAREPFDLDPLLALGKADRFAGWSEEIGHRLAPSANSTTATCSLAWTRAVTCTSSPTGRPASAACRRPWRTS